MISEWHPTLNDELRPDAVTYGSHKKVWWLGPCGHEYQRLVKNRTLRSIKCPKCPGKAPVSVTHPHLVPEWHPTLNGDLRPEDVSKGSKRDVWWVCGKGHPVWMSAVRNRASGAAGCPYCSGNLPILGETDFASQMPHLVPQWHSTKNTCGPHEVTQSSNTKRWWVCPRCDQDYLARVFVRRRGDGCPVCAGHVVVSGINDFQSLNPEKAAEWSPRNSVRPDEVPNRSNKKIWWVCSTCSHEWQSSVDSRSTRGTGCPVCARRLNVSKAEQELADYVRSLGFEIRTSDRTIIRPKELDIYVPELKKAIEYNGTYWHGPKHRPLDWDTHRQAKTELAAANGIALLHIEEEDYTQDPEEVQRTVREFLDIRAAA